MKTRVVASISVLRTRSTVTGRSPARRRRRRAVNARAIGSTVNHKANCSSAFAHAARVLP
jgi:hypothetical protein